jgi:hypothetical protein
MPAQDSISKSRHGKALYLTRESFDLASQRLVWIDSVPDAQATKLVSGIASMRLVIYAENDLVIRQWMSEWNYHSMPQLIKFSFKTDHGRDPPELIVQPKIEVKKPAVMKTIFSSQCTTSSMISVKTISPSRQNTQSEGSPSLLFCG